MKTIALAIVVLLLAASPVMAARAPAPTLAVSPDPVPAQSAFAVEGCGYTPDTGIRLILEAPGGLAFWGGMTDAAGCFVNTVGWATYPGEATLSASYYGAHAKKPIAQLTFTISG